MEHISFVYNVPRMIENLFMQHQFTMYLGTQDRTSVLVGFVYSVAIEHFVTMVEHELRSTCVTHMLPMSGVQGQRSTPYLTP